MEILHIILIRNLIICLISSIPGLFLSNYLEKNGLVRKQSIMWYFGWVIIPAMLGSIMNPEMHRAFYIFIIIITTTCGYQRFELWATFRLGRWWWKEKGNH